MKNEQCFAVSEENGGITVQRPGCSFNWKASQNAVTSLAWSFDDEILAAGAADFGVTLWNLEHTLSTTLPSLHTSSISTVAFNPFSPFELLSAERDGRILLQDIRTKAKGRLFEQKKRLIGKQHRPVLNEAHFLPLDNWTISALFQDSLILFDARYFGWREVEKFACPSPKGFVSCSFDANGNEAFILGNDSQVYSLATKAFGSFSYFQSPCQISSFYSKIKQVEIWGRPFLFTTSQSGSLVTWDLKEQKAFEVKEPFERETSCLDFGLCRNELVVCSDDKISCLVNFLAESPRPEIKTFSLCKFERKEADSNSSECTPCSSNSATPAKKPKRQSLINWLSP